MAESYNGDKIDAPMLHVDFVPGGLIYFGDYIVDGPSDIVALSGYSEVTGNLIINNPTTPVTSLIGLEGLTSVDETLDIRFNSALTSLEVLNNLSSVGEYLNIYSNPSLTNLEGLNNLTAVGGDFIITQNINLCTSLAEDLRDQVFNTGGISGEIYITGNKTCP